MSSPPGGCQSCAKHNSSHLRKLNLDVSQCDFVVALAGNPNVGKSTVFNSLTGLRQHTGNWPGKTVGRAEGGYEFRDQRYKLVDLPGTYSLLSASHDEEIARDFLLFARPDVTIIVVDATRLERNLNLLLQVLEITDRAVLCLNLMDEARRHGLTLETRTLARELGIPVVATSARFAQGLDELLEAVRQVATGEFVCQPRRVPMREENRALKAAVQQVTERMLELIPQLPNARWVALRLLAGDPTITQALQQGELSQQEGASQPSFEECREVCNLAENLRWEVGRDFHDNVVEAIFADAARIADRVVRRADDAKAPTWDQTLDKIVTSRTLGFPIMVMMLALVFYLTIVGANVPSAMLASLLLDTLQPMLKTLANGLGSPWWLTGFLIDGVYTGGAWVVSVMLPPMAIFFPLFTLLEDFGYLPRVAFNLDRVFKFAGAHGKQALTMTMGFGCNAAGIVATRIIDSPREKLIAIITNNFSLCNGRWPTQILIASIFVASLVPPALAGLASAAAVVSIALLGIFLSFVVSWMLSQTVLRGEASSFSLELPPYRPPMVLQTLYTSLIDRTMVVLWRATIFALPCGGLIWLLGNLTLGGQSLAAHLVHFLNPLGLLLGLNGVILLAYVIAIPANEIVIPTVLMLTVLTSRLSGVGAGAGVMFEPDSNAMVSDILVGGGGWTALTGINLMIFSLLHNPCSTTIYTIWKETHSWRWTAVATFLPVVMGVTACFLTTQVWRLLHP
jgi:ferrous iron transport protein B